MSPREKPLPLPTTFLQSLTPDERSQVLGTARFVPGKHAPASALPTNPWRTRGDAQDWGQVEGRVQHNLLQTELSKLGCALQTSHERERSLKAQITTSQTLLGEQVKATRQTEEQLRCVEAAAGTYQARIASLTGTISSLRDETAALQAALAAANRQNSRLQDQLMEAKAQHTELQERYIQCLQGCQPGAATLPAPGALSLRCDVPPDKGWADDAWGDALGLLEGPQGPPAGKLAGLQAQLRVVSRQRDALSNRVKHLTNKLAETQGQVVAGRTRRAAQHAAAHRTIAAAVCRARAAQTRVDALVQEGQARQLLLKQKCEYIQRLEQAMLAQHTALQQLQAKQHHSPQLPSSPSPLAVRAHHPAASPCVNTRPASASPCPSPAPVGHQHQQLAAQPCQGVWNRDIEAELEAVQQQISRLARDMILPHNQHHLHFLRTATLSSTPAGQAGAQSGTAPSSPRQDSPPSPHRPRDQTHASSTAYQQPHHQQPQASFPVRQPSPDGGSAGARKPWVPARCISHSPASAPPPPPASDPPPAHAAAAARLSALASRRRAAQVARLQADTASPGPHDCITPPHHPQQQQSVGIGDVQQVAVQVCGEGGVSVRGRRQVLRPGHRQQQVSPSPVARPLPGYTLRPVKQHRTPSRAAAATTTAAAAANTVHEDASDLDVVVCDDQHHKRRSSSSSSPREGGAHSGAEGLQGLIAAGRDTQMHWYDTSPRAWSQPLGSSSPAQACSSPASSMPSSPGHHSGYSITAHSLQLHHQAVDRAWEPAQPAAAAAPSSAVIRPSSSAHTHVRPGSCSRSTTSPALYPGRSPSVQREQEVDQAGTPAAHTPSPSCLPSPSLPSCTPQLAHTMNLMRTRRSHHSPLDSPVHPPAYLLSPPPAAHTPAASSPTPCSSAPDTHRQHSYLGQHAGSHSLDVSLPGGGQLSVQAHSPARVRVSWSAQGSPHALPPDSALASPTTSLQQAGQLTGSVGWDGGASHHVGATPWTSSSTTQLSIPAETAASASLEPLPLPASLVQWAAVGQPAALPMDSPEDRPDRNAEGGDVLDVDVLSQACQALQLLTARLSAI